MTALTTSVTAVGGRASIVRINPVAKLAAALLLAVAIQVRRRHRSGDPEELSAVKG